MDIFMFANTKVWTEECFLPQKKKKNTMNWYFYSMFHSIEYELVSFYKKVRFMNSYVFMRFHFYFLTSVSDRYTLLIFLVF